MTFDLGTVPTYANTLVSFWHMIELCRNRRDCFLSIRAITRVQQPVQSEWHIQDGGQLFLKTVPFLPAIAHKSETK